MQLTLRYPIYQFLAILTSILTLLHIGIPIVAPPVHAYDSSSLLLWAGSVPSFVFIIWTSYRTIEDYFCNCNSDFHGGVERVRTSSDVDVEDARFTAVFAMALAAAATCKMILTTLMVAVEDGWEMRCS
jgi:hypothetical protein